MSATAPPQATRAYEQRLKRARQRDEPTRVRTVRNQYAQQLRGRWDAIRAAAREGIVERDAFGLQREGLADAPGPREFDFDRVPEQVEAFARWLNRQTERDIMQRFGQDNQLIRRAYERGVDDAQAALSALELDEGRVGTSALRLPVHREQLQALFARNLNALEGMTDAVANDLRRVLSEGLAAGENPRTIAERIADRIDAVGRTRATVIARTEIMHSHNRARAREWRRAGVDQVGILIAPDACPQCQALKASEPYPARQGPALLPQHPNCRCALVVWTGS